MLAHIPAANQSTEQPAFYQQTNRHLSCVSTLLHRRTASQSLQVLDVSYCDISPGQVHQIIGYGSRLQVRRHTELCLRAPDRSHYYYGLFVPLVLLPSFCRSTSVQFSHMISIVAVQKLTVSAIDSIKEPCVDSCTCFCLQELHLSGVSGIDPDLWKILNDNAQKSANNSGQDASSQTGSTDVTMTAADCPTGNSLLKIPDQATNACTSIAPVAQPQPLLLSNLQVLSLVSCQQLTSFCLGLQPQQPLEVRPAVVIA